MTASTTLVILIPMGRKTGAKVFLRPFSALYPRR
jgi:hypothetical protein